MKKALQLGINDICLEEMDRVNADIENSGIARVTRLRTCNAKVYETANYYVLVSYSTAVAFIRKSDSTLFDVLRLFWFVYRKHHQGCHQLQYNDKFRTIPGVYFSKCSYLAAAWCSVCGAGLLL